VAVGGDDVVAAVQAQEDDGQAAMRSPAGVSGSDQRLVFLVGDVAAQ
jgi:hypothetical protein